jgi:thymidine phosphorylase
VGLELTGKVGDQVRVGDLLLKVYYDEASRLDEALEQIRGAYEIGEEPAQPVPLMHKVIS